VKPFRRVTGRAAVLDRPDVDTDQIVPKQFLKRIERTGFGEVLFHDWRYDETGAPRPEFELNRPEFAGARVLLAGRNFGCGSSREHAAWALQDYGFDAVVAPSFGDIFRSNAGKIGLAAISLPEEEVHRLMESVDLDTGSEVTVDLEARTITAPGGRTVAFDFDETTRTRLLEGLDDIAITLRHEDEIAAYERGLTPQGSDPATAARP
jgi:3-isopropylmalate/(R)-2-methylmalate dehydratase small subunit